MLRLRGDRLFRGYGPILAVYLLAGIILMAGPPNQQIWPLLVALACFTVWDLSWLWYYGCETERSAHEMLESSTRARTYMSYFIAIYGAATAYYVLRSEPAENRALAALLRDASVPPWLAVAPLIVSVVALLFLPIQLGSGMTDDDLRSVDPSPANVSVVVFVAWSQKVSMYTFTYVALMLASSTWQAS